MGWSIHHKTGLLHHDDSHAFQGYTLIAMSGGDTAYLIDMEGRVCHRWHHEDGLAYGVLLAQRKLALPIAWGRGHGGAGRAGYRHHGAGLGRQRRVGVLGRAGAP